MNSPFRLLTSYRHAVTLLGLCNSLLIASNVAGQTTPGPQPHNTAINLEDVYRIEMVAFANNNSYSDEQWPARPVLNYPSQLLFLGETAAPKMDAAHAENMAEPALSTDTVADTTTEPSGAITNDVFITPQLLRKLPPEERTLNESAAALDRRNAYRVVFHEAWLQRLEAPDHAAALVVNGGRAMGDHFVLEGSVTFSKKRFLHINSNLWLNTFDNLPRRAEQDNWQHYYADTITLPPVPTAPPAMSNNNSELNDDVDTQLTGRLSEDYETTQTISVINKQESRPNDFIVKRAYTLKEYRRLRRDEVHYLDHPRFGLLVTISKYEPKLEGSN